MTSPVPATLNRSVVTIGDRTVPLSALTLRALRPVLRDLEFLRHSVPGALPDAQQLDAMLRVIHASASVIVPALTLEELTGYFLDAPMPGQDALALVAEAFTLTQTLSLPKVEEQGKEQPAGEAPSP